MGKRWFHRLDLPLVFIVMLSAFLTMYNIWTDQYVNTYYTTAVGSMMESFYNFFFASLDSAGSVTLDKPPVTFWIQTISAKIFGLEGWSVILPQALSAIGSVLLIYFLIKPSFGTLAARLAALAMAITPIAVAVSRTNNIDSMLVFTLLLATSLLFRGVKKENMWLVMGAFALVGVAFNMKMLQAYMVLPAFYLFYWLAVKVNWKKKLGIVTGATAVLIVISLSWAVIVDSIPEDERPYVGSSEINSVLELAFGYNGISRLTGNQGGNPTGGGSPGNQSGTNDRALPEGMPSQDQGDQGQQLPDGTNERGPGAGGPNMQNGPRGGGPGGMFGTGEEGPLRLFKQSLSGQASWLLPFVLLASISLMSRDPIRQMRQRTKEVVFWLAWLVPVAGFFSIAGFFHHYYLIMLAPPIAALFGSGAVQIFQDYCSRNGWRGWIFPFAILVTAIFHWYTMKPYNDVIGQEWSIGVLVISVAVFLTLVILKIKAVTMKPLGVMFILVLLVGPLYWAATPIVYGGNSMLPQAGPQGGMGMPQGGRTQDGQMPDPSTSLEEEGYMDEGMSPGRGGTPMMGGQQEESLDEKTLTYLRENQTDEEYLFATISYTVAAPYIIDKDESVIIMGGFSGGDPVYSVSEMEELVSEGKVKYFLLSERGFGRGGSEVSEWIMDNGQEIPAEEWSTNDSDEQSQGPGGSEGSNSLYKVTLSEGEENNE
ncbi:glycosyltransferase family 39 protein [Salibacterium lacus]|uniref:Glycosyltransferase family 39 protein n=1 Tax=Salibacterium lacus TaxID=1898109 RepID=A0ABW5T195_9BACI